MVLLSGGHTGGALFQTKILGGGTFKSGAGTFFGTTVKNIRFHQLGI